MAQFFKFIFDNVKCRIDEAYTFKMKLIVSAVLTIKILHADFFCFSQAEDI